MKLPKEDVLNAIVTDLVADQVLRALELGYGRKDVEAAVGRGMSHGICEFMERREEMEATRTFIEGSEAAR